MKHLKLLVVGSLLFLNAQASSSSSGSSSSSSKSSSNFLNPTTNTQQVMKRLKDNCRAVQIKAIHTDDQAVVYTQIPSMFCNQHTMVSADRQLGKGAFARFKNAKKLNTPYQQGALDGISGVNELLSIMHKKGFVCVHLGELERLVNHARQEGHDAAVQKTVENLDALMKPVIERAEAKGRQEGFEERKQEVERARVEGRQEGRNEALDEMCKDEWIYCIPEHSYIYNHDASCLNDENKKRKRDQDQSEDPFDCFDTQEGCPPSTRTQS